MAKGHENLIPANRRSKEEARENGRKGGVKSGEARREKRDLKERAKLWMDLAADPRVAAAMSKTGISVEDNADVILAGVMKGVLRGDTKALTMWLDLTGQNPRSDDKAKQAQVRKAEAEAERAQMETELFKMRLDAIKGVGQEELPDDGFLDALKSTAAEDWGDDVL